MKINVSFIRIFQFPEFGNANCLCDEFKDCSRQPSTDRQQELEGWTCCLTELDILYQEFESNEEKESEDGKNEM